MQRNWFIHQLMAVIAMNYSLTCSQFVYSSNFPQQIREQRHAQEQTQQMVEDTSPDLFTVEAELGYVFVSGITESRTINGRLYTQRDSKKHQHEINIEALNAVVDGSSEAEQYYSEFEFGKKMNARDLIILKNKYEVDRFSGYEYQLSSALVFKREIFTGEKIGLNKHLLSIASGPGFRKSRILNGGIEENAILSLSFEYQLPLNEIVLFSQLADTEAGEENTATRLVSKFDLKIAENLAMRISLTSKFNSRNLEGDASVVRTSSMTLAYLF